MMEKEYKYIVAIQCFTFNQSKYIIDALNGFIMQKTNFPYIIMIVDDASTDGEQEVINNFVSKHFNIADHDVAYEKETDYAYIKYAQHITNLNCYIIAMFLKENHYCQRKFKLPYLSDWRDNVKYEALCEGDDYWTDSLKLQKQVDFLENNKDYVMCHSNFRCSDGRYRNHNIYLSSDDYYFPESVLYGQLRVGTLTVLYRMDAYNKLPKLWSGKGWPVGDAPMWIEFSKEGKIKYLTDVTATYRILTTSASHGSIEKEIAFTDANVMIRKFYSNYYGLQIINDGYSKGYFITIMKYAFKHRNKKVAYEYKLKAEELELASWKMYVFYYATIFPLIRYIVRNIVYR